MSVTLENVEFLTQPTRDLGGLSRPSQTMLEALAAGLSDATRGDAGSSPLGPAMAYSLQLSGKQARGHLVLLVAAGWGTDWRTARVCAQAVEMVHTASLIIDDLPAMDNAAIRRGEPTNHLKFGEPAAILAAIAMLSDAFQVIATSDVLRADYRAEAIAALARAVGPEGMAGGQQLDMTPARERADDIELVHAMKTGALFAAAAEIGSIVSGIGGSRRWLMSDFGMLLGKAFQELDDLIDKHGDGRAAGKDLAKDLHKPTLVGLLGRDKAEVHALQQVALALECLEASGLSHQDDLRHYVLCLTQTMRRKLVTP